jgi:hypothetical protein
MLGPGTGAQKLAASAPLVANILKTSELVSGKKIADEVLFMQGATDITSGMAKILNSLHPDAATTAGTPLPTSANTGVTTNAPAKPVS